MPGFGTARTYINANKVLNAPAGHTIPLAPASIAAAIIEEIEIIELTAGTYTNANKATAFDALIAALDAAIQSLIENTYKIDPAVYDIDYNAEVVLVKRGDTADDVFLAEANDSFFCTVNLSIVPA